MKPLVVADGEKTIFLRIDGEVDSYVIACSGQQVLITQYIMGLLDSGYAVQYIGVDEFIEASSSKGHITTDEELEIIAIYKKFPY